jgi:hypothetical protein
MVLPSVKLSNYEEEQASASDTVRRVQALWCGEGENAQPTSVEQRCSREDAGNQGFRFEMALDLCVTTGAVFCFVHINVLRSASDSCFLKLSQKITSLWLSRAS